MTQRGSKSKNLYHIHYRHPKDGKMISLKAGSVEDSSLGLSFVRISDFIFDTSTLVVKPSEEQLKKELEGVKAVHMSLYSIVSIEELGNSHKGLKFKKDKANLLAFPASNENPPKK